MNRLQCSAHAWIAKCLLQDNQGSYEETSDLGFRSKPVKITVVFKPAPTADYKDQEWIPTAFPTLHPSCNVNMCSVSHDVIKEQLGNKRLAKIKI